jgi:hypothetical protein
LPIFPSTTRRATALRTFLYIAAVIALCVASRLPQLQSPNLLADGDECTLGLMAKHVAEGKEFPLFFYGQHYAFSPVEETAGAVAFALFGVGAVPLKAAGLALWTVGIVFFFLALAKVIGQACSVAATAVLVLNPVWAAWSMKAGGGYLTAFAAAAVLVWLLLRDPARETAMRWIVAGALTAVIDLAQPLWLPGLVPIVLAVLASRRRWAWGVIYLSVTAALLLLVKVATPTDPADWTGPDLGNPHLIASLSGVARQIYVYFTGAYYLSWAIDPPGRVTGVLAVVWCGVLTLAVMIQAYRLLARRYCIASHVLFLSVASTLVAEWLLLAARDARYLLPLGAPLVALAAVEVVDLVERRFVSWKTVAVVTCGTLLLGALSMREFREFNYLWKNPPERWAERKRLQQVFGYLKVKDVTHVFSMNGLLDTQLVFYSDEKILARWTHPVGKYHPYVKEVNRALADGEPVAVVGYTHTSGAPGCSDVPICSGGLENMVPDPESMFIVDDKYFVYVGANRDVLKRLGFRFWD